MPDLSLDYPANDRNVPRYAQPHPRIAARIEADQRVAAAFLRSIAGYAEPLSRIPVHETDPGTPCWVNGFLPGLDGAAIYTALRQWQPARYIEIGSGNSTRFAARAIADGRLGTKVTSIDPYPRAEIDDLCDELVRTPFESSDLAIFDGVRPGDIVFMDGSHRVFMNNDVVAFFLDVLPSLPADVLVGVHDIYLPYDYPLAIADRYYSEQYLLAAWLLGGASAEIVLAAHWASLHLADACRELWETMPALAEIEHHGAAFWLRTR
jgi:hypothetical protein